MATIDRLITSAAVGLTTMGQKVRILVPGLLISGWFLGALFAKPLFEASGVSHDRLLSVYFVSLGILGMSLWSYYRAAWGSPGFIPPGVDTPPGDPTLEELSLPWCYRCDGRKPPRTHHCKRCARCVVGMCHHCLFTDNCVGAFNLKSYLLFLVYTILNTGAGILITVCHAGSFYMLIWYLFAESDAVNPNEFGIRVQDPAMAAVGIGTQGWGAILLQLLAFLVWLAVNTVLGSLLLLCTLSTIFLGYLLYWQGWLISYGTSTIDWEDTVEQIQSGEIQHPSRSVMLQHWLEVLGIQTDWKEHGMWSCLRSILLTGIPTRTNPLHRVLARWGLTEQMCLASSQPKSLDQELREV